MTKSNYKKYNSFDEFNKDGYNLSEYIKRNTVGLCNTDKINYARKMFTDNILNSYIIIGNISDDIKNLLNYTFKDNVIWLNPCFNYQQHPFIKGLVTSKYTKDDLDFAKNHITIIHYNSRFKPWQSGHYGFFKGKYINEMLLNGYYVQTLRCLFDFKEITQGVFSIKNDRDKSHKVISILGIKIKFRRNNNAKS